MDNESLFPLINGFQPLMDIYPLMVKIMDFSIKLMEFTGIFLSHMIIILFLHIIAQPDM